MGTTASERTVPTPGSRLLRGVMTKRGLTQERVAELMGCSQQTVSGWLRAAFVPTSAEHLVRLRDLFGIPPEAWLTTAQRRSLKRASGGVPAIAA